MTTRRDLRTAFFGIVSGLNDEREWKDYKTVEICGRSCNVQIRGRFHKWNEWVWDGRCECGGIAGSSRHNRSKDEAAENAIKDFVSKA